MNSQKKTPSIARGLLFSSASNLWSFEHLPNIGILLRLPKSEFMRLQVTRFPPSLRLRAKVGQIKDEVPPIRFHRKNYMTSLDADFFPINFPFNRRINA